MRIKPEILIAGFALIVSIASAYASIFFSRAIMKTDALPVVVVVYNSALGWSVRNIGNGPALNVIVAHQNHDSNGWEMPTKIYPLPTGESVKLTWVGVNPDKIAIEYRNVHNDIYTTMTDDDLSTIHRRKLLPSWPSDSVARIWEHTKQ